MQHILWFLLLLFFHSLLSLSLFPSTVSLCRSTFQSLFPVFNFALLFPRPQPIPSRSLFSPPFFGGGGFLLLPQPCTFLPPLLLEDTDCRCCNLPGLTLSIAPNNIERVPVHPTDHEGIASVSGLIWHHDSAASW